MSKLIRFGVSLEKELSDKFDRLIKETSTGDEENVPVVTFQKLLKPQISEDRDAKAPYEAISIDAEKEPDGPEKEKPDNEDDKKKQIIIEEPDARVRTEPIGITRAREMIDELDSEKARRLRILQSPIGRKTDLPGAPKMPPPGGKSTR